MAPQIVDNGVMENVDRKVAMKALQLNNLRKEIPEEAFKKSVFKGIYYMTIDYAMWAGTIFAIYSLTNSSVWATMPYWQQTLASILYWNVAGFLMWCIFITGHDCGHGTFAESETVNDIFGHITHGSIMVPFYSWQVREATYYSQILTNFILISSSILSYCYLSSLSNEEYVLTLPPHSVIDHHIITLS